MFNIGIIIFFTAFVIFIAVITVGLIFTKKSWQKDNASPVISSKAEIISKRTAEKSSSKSLYGGCKFYYVIFLLESGEKREFRVEAEDYAVLSQNSKGTLTFKGKRFLGFEEENLSEQTAE